MKFEVYEKRGFDSLTHSLELILQVLSFELGHLKLIGDLGLDRRLGKEFFQWPQKVSVDVEVVVRHVRPVYED